MKFQFFLAFLKYFAKCVQYGTIFKCEKSALVGGESEPRKRRGGGLPVHLWSAVIKFQLCWSFDLSTWLSRGKSPASLVIRTEEFWLRTRKGKLPRRRTHDERIFGGLTYQPGPSAVAAPQFQRCRRSLRSRYWSTSSTLKLFGFLHICDCCSEVNTKEGNVSATLRLLHSSSLKKEALSSHRIVASSHWRNGGERWAAQDPRFEL